MSMKKFELEKLKALKIGGRMAAAGVPDRFAQGAATATEKREQRKRDAAAGLVPFACKLPAELVKQVQARVAAESGDVNGVVAALLLKALA
jgi:hypothetical protein